MPAGSPGCVSMLLWACDVMASSGRWLLVKPGSDRPRAEPPPLSSSSIIFSCRPCLQGLLPAQDVRQATARLTQPGPGAVQLLGGWLI